MCNCKGCKYITIALALLLAVAIGYIVYDKNACPFSTASGPVGSDDVVVAVVGGENVWLSEVVAFHDAIPHFRTLPLESSYSDILNYITEGKALSFAAQKAGTKNTEEYKKSAKRFFEDILRGTYIENEIKRLVTEEKLKEAYAEYVKANPGEEEVRASHILVDSEDTAKEIIADIKDGGDFATLAREKSKDANGANGGDLGYFKKAAMVPEFAEAAFSMQVGEVSKKPVKTMFGWHILKVTDKRHSGATPFEQVKDSLRMQQAQNIVPEILKKAKDDAKIEIKHESYPVKAEDKAETEPATAAPEAKVEVEAKAEPTEAAVETKAEVKGEAKPENEAAVKDASKTEPAKEAVAPADANADTEADIDVEEVEVEVEADGK